MLCFVFQNIYMQYEVANTSRFYLNTLLFIELGVLWWWEIYFDIKWIISFII